jgi:hypothetical protein
MINKEEYCEKLEEEVVSLRVEINKLNKNLKISQVLEDIINSQSPCYDKFGLGYKKIVFEKDSSSMTKEQQQNIMQKSS